jgi:transcriptional regulator with XRE-family HTH domain
MTIDVGARLKEARLEHNMSQRALAKRSGISNATISLIEAGKLDPSVAVLKKILVGIKMDLAEFFAAESAGPEPVVYRADELLEIGQGSISYRQVGHHIENRSIQILHERYAPGTATGRVSLRHAGEEGGVVIRGQLELTVAGERHLLGPGDAYYFESSQPHHFRNVGTEECEVVSACCPPGL